MEDRDERSALPSRRDVGGAEIVDDGQARPPGKRGAVADLDGEPPIGCVEHGLAVEAHDGGGDTLSGSVGREGVDGGGMGLGDQTFGRGDRARPLVAVDDGAASARAARSRSRSAGS